MKKLPLLLLSILFLSIFLSPARTDAQNRSETMDDVKLFQSFFRDAPINAAPYAEGGLSFGDYEWVSIIGLGVRGGFSVTPEFELGAGLSFASYNPENDAADNESGLEDLPVYGRYNFVNESQTKVSGGAFLTLPTGKEEIGGGNVDFGFFGAVRHAVSPEVVLTGTLGLGFLEYGDDRETSLNLGGGVIYAATEEVSIVGELSLESEVDYAVLSGGVDYAVTETGRLRGALLIGLDDGAPDIGLMAGYLLTF